jgi:hypothetical protein
MAAVPPVNPRVIAELRHYQLQANRQLGDYGKMHLDAAREAGFVANKGLQISFPQGQPGQTVKVAVVQEGEQVKAIANDKEKTLTEGESGT